MKGIILAGGSGSRLHPLTLAVSKQMLPVYDKPMIYYPLSLLMLAAIRDILVISTPEDSPRFEQLLRYGENFGIKISHAVQPTPGGLAEAFIIADKFIGNDRCAMVLGDNIYYGEELPLLLKEASEKKSGATIFAYRVKRPERYGVIEFDKSKRVSKIVEKPKKTKSKYAVTGLYFYDNRVVEMAKSLSPSERGELEISDLNQKYLDENLLDVKLLSKDTTWFDVGTHDSLFAASLFMKKIERKEGIKVACPEEIAYSMGFIDRNKLLSIASTLHNSYGDYLRTVAIPKHIQNLEF